LGHRLGIKTLSISAIYNPFLEGTKIGQKLLHSQEKHKVYTETTHIDNGT
jgi:hypothetical protein